MKKAEFLPFDPENWPRRSHFEHYRKSGCSFNLTAKVNIRSFLDTCRRTGVRSYPALAVLVTQTVNRIPEFRTAVDADGRPGYWEYVSPSLPVFHEEDHTFSCFCTPYDPDARNFYDALTADLERRSRERGILLGEFPPNLVHLSCLPWFPTTAFSLELQDAGCLAPVITWGRYESADERTLLPVSLRLNHAAADGWHASLFLRLLEESAANFNILS